MPAKAFDASGERAGSAGIAGVADSVGFAGITGAAGAVGIADSAGAAGTAGFAGTAGAAGVAETPAAPDARAVCGICPHACALAEGEHGRCRARVARGGVVVPENYGRVTSLALDPIEKKPLAEFHPGSTVLSVGSYGCNLDCPFCQNARIACAGEADVPWRELAPEALVARALELRGEGCIGLAFTYNEPLVGYEYVRDCARLSHEAGLKNVLVSNGFVNEGPLRALAPLIDAANIDLKGYSDDFYEEVDGDLAVVERSISILAGEPGCHVEITTLVVPGMNDSRGLMEAQAAWIAGLDRTIPLHVSRFFPAHRMADAEPTPRPTMIAMAGTAAKRLDSVYYGNMG